MYGYVNRNIKFSNVKLNLLLSSCIHGFVLYYTAIKLLKGKKVYNIIINFFPFKSLIAME